MPHYLKYTYNLKSTCNIQIYNYVYLSFFSIDQARNIPFIIDAAETREYRRDDISILSRAVIR